MVCVRGHAEPCAWYHHYHVPHPRRGGFRTRPYGARPYGTRPYEIRIHGTRIQGIRPYGTLTSGCGCFFRSVSKCCKSIRPFESIAIDIARALPSSTKSSIV
jgi:hypothetical protein